MCESFKHFHICTFFTHNSKDHYPVMMNSSISNSQIFFNLSNSQIPAEKINYPISLFSLLLWRLPYIYISVYCNLELSPLPNSEFLWILSIPLQEVQCGSYFQRVCHIKDVVWSQQQGETLHKWCCWFFNGNLAIDSKVISLCCQRCFTCESNERYNLIWQIPII